jgi:subtilisin family serine protease
MSGGGTWRGRWCVAAMLATALVAVGAVPASGSTAPRQQPDPPPTGDPEVVIPAAGGGDRAGVLADAVSASPTGTARVIVALGAASELGAVLEGTDSRVVSELDVVPAAVAEVDEAGLAALLADPAVEAVTLDREGGIALDQSTGVIDSDLLNRAGVLGNNYDGSRGGPYEVVVIDTGVDRQHDAFRGRIVAEACFSAGSWCPNGSTSQRGPGAGDNCTYAPECDHGTHVAGIAAGTDYQGGHEGVARGVGVVAIQIGHRRSCGGRRCWRFLQSELDAALEHVVELIDDGRRIASVNISLGGSLFSSEAACAAVTPTTHQLMTHLQAAGVVVVAAAGNQAMVGAISWPACLPGVYAVSATDDHDRIAQFTNSGALTDFWAPGVDIVAPVPGAPTSNASFNGTSMAAPHVSGAFALLRECPGNRNDTAVARDLRAVGPRINDEGVRRRRINVLAAATRNVPNNNFAVATALPRTGVVDQAAFNICADAERGEPGPGVMQNSVWFTWRPRRGGRVVISTDNGGGNRTTFDTELTVFTGGRLGALRLVDHDNNSGAGNRSRVAFRARADTTYRIRVDGVHARNGWFNLHIHRP